MLRLLGDSDDWKSAVFWQQPRGYFSEWQKEYQGYSVRTKQFRYSEYVTILHGDQDDQAPNWSDQEDVGELYDLMVDPEENKNLYQDDALHDIKIELQKILHAGWIEHNQ